MYFLGEVGGLFGTVTVAHGGNHIALGSRAHSGATALQGAFLYLVPQIELSALHLVGLGVGLDFLDNLVDFLHFEVDDVVHDSLGQHHMLVEEVEIEIGLRRERINYIRIEVDGQQTAAVVGTEGYLTARIGRDGFETEVGIAIGHRFANDGIPEEDSGLGRFPGIVHNLFPECLRIDLLRHLGIGRVDGELLYVGLAGGGSFHKVVVNLHRYVGTGYPAFDHLGVDERLGVGVLDRYRQHQRAPAAVLCHLAGRVGVTLHERHQTG